MKTFEELLAELRAIDRVRGPRYVLDFEDVLAEMIALKDDGMIVPLMEFFDDEPPYLELMFSIIHTIESFDRETYIAQTLTGMPSLRERSPEWAETLIIRMLNSEQDRGALIRRLDTSDSQTKHSIRTILERINARGVDSLEKSAPVIAATEK